MFMGHYMGGVMYGATPSDNEATHSGKGSICSKLFVRQGFCGWSGRVEVMNSCFCAFVLVEESNENYPPMFTKPHSGAPVRRLVTLHFLDRGVLRTLLL